MLKFFRDHKQLVQDKQAKLLELSGDFFFDPQANCLSLIIKKANEDEARFQHALFELVKGLLPKLKVENAKQKTLKINGKLQPTHDKNQLKTVRVPLLTAADFSSKAKKVEKQWERAAELLLCSIAHLLSPFSALRHQGDRCAGLGKRKRIINKA